MIVDSLNNLINKFYLFAVSGIEFTSITGALDVFSP